MTDRGSGGMDDIRPLSSVDYITAVKREGRVLAAFKILVQEQRLWSKQSRIIGRR